MSIAGITLHDVDYWKKWDEKELNYQMSPIHWIGKKDKRTMYIQHIQFCKEETTRARDSIPCNLDISYGPTEYEKLDIYGKDLPSNAPTLLWVHGGYWRAGDRNESAYFVRTAHSWGFKSVVIDYPLCPKYRMADMSNGICRAIKEAMNLLPNSEFYIGGHSAGTQLLSTLFYEIPSIEKLPEALMDRVKGVILVSGTFDMRPAIDMHTIVNKALQLKETEAPQFSSILNIDKVHSGWTKNSNKMKFIMLYGEKDPPTLQKFGEIYADLLRKKQFWVEYWISKMDDHYSIVENMAVQDSDVSKKLKYFLLRDCRQIHSKL